MNRIPIFLAACAAFLGPEAEAQAVGPRSADYLFVSTVGDARALWVNPAGLQFSSMASLIAEVVVDRSNPDETRVGQWSAGLSTRGFSFGYQRDRLVNDSSNQAFRIGAGTVFPRGAIGIAATFHRSDSTSRALDVGLRYLPILPIQIGLVVRNIGKPSVRSERLPVTGVAGLSWWGATGRIVIAGESVIADRIDASGYDVAYRAGLRLTMGSRTPVSGVFAVLLNSDMAVHSWTVGLAVGGDRRAVAMGTVGRSDGTADLDLVSLTAVAINRSPRITRR